MRKFSLLAHSRIASLGKVALAVGAVTGVALTHCAGQTPAPTPTPKPQAYVRFWNMLPNPPPTLLELLSGDTSLTTAAACNFYATYFTVQPGAYTFTVRKMNDKNGAIKRLPVNLLADTYITLLAYSKNGQADVEMTNDTIDPKAAPSGQLVIRQLFPNAKVTVFLGGTAASGPLGYGETFTIPNLPMGMNALSVQAAIPGQSIKPWSTQMDLSQDHHNTLLIFSDSYGRYRPRLAVDGHAILDDSRRVEKSR